MRATKEKNIEYTAVMFPLNPEFFDTFGILVFLYITAMAVWGLNSKKRLPQWAFTLLLLIGLSGLFVDGFIVYVYFVSPIAEAVL